VTCVVDSLSGFEHRARANAGVKASALEIAGLASDRNAASAANENLPPDPAPSEDRLLAGMKESSPDQGGPKHKWPEREPAVEQYKVPLPERYLDWGL